MSGAMRFAAGILPAFLVAVAVSAPAAGDDAAPATLRSVTGGPTLEGKKVSLDLGAKRANWTHGKWEILDLDKPIDLSRFGSVRVTISTDKPRGDVGVTVAIKENDGSWLSCPWTVDLTQAVNAGTARFDDFSVMSFHAPAGGSDKDENDRLDPKHTKALAVGIVNPMGVGVVNFTIEKIEFLPAAAPETAALPVHVTGKLLEVNGTKVLPAGVFGCFYLEQMEARTKQWVEIDGKQYIVHDNLAEVGGKPYLVAWPEPGSPGRIAVGDKNYDVQFEMTKVQRSEIFRLCSDRKINFGIYQSKPLHGDASHPIYINCAGDRGQVNPRFSDPTWKEKFAGAGKSFGEAVKADGKLTYVEFWNEPYLNWANYNRIMFKPDLFDQGKAEEGKNVCLKSTGEEVPFLKWTRDFTKPVYQWTTSLQEWRRGKDDKGQPGMKMHAAPFMQRAKAVTAQAAKFNPPDTVKDGEKYTAGDGKTYTAYTPWHVHDESQFTHWSARGLVMPYLDTMLAYYTPLREAAGDKAVLIAGWCHRPSEDHWAAWDILYKPVVDAGIKIIDALNDHDYGGNAINMPTNYEVACAYSVTKYGKPLTFYNTECSLAADPSVTGEDGAISSDALRFRWFSRKCASALDFVPDKARLFMHFGTGQNFWSDLGEGVAAAAMRNVRGRLVQTIKADDRLYAVACVDGTDAMVPRPAFMPQRQELVVLVVNDHPTTRDVDLTVDAPAGTKFAWGYAKVSRIDWSRGLPLVTTRMLTSDGATCKFKQAVEPGTPLILTLPLQGEVKADAPAAAVRKQFFGDAIIKEVTGKGPIEQKVELKGVDLAKVKRAWVKLVTERLAEGEGLVTVNGRDLPIGSAMTPENTSYIRIVQVAPADLKAVNELKFHTAKATDAGYFLGMCSIEVEME